MPVEVFHGAGIDGHKETAVVTIRHQSPDQLTPSRQETRTFGTLTDNLHALPAWVTGRGHHPCPHGVHRLVWETAR